MLQPKETVALHKGTAPDGRVLSAREREQLLNRFLPTAPSAAQQQRPARQTSSRASRRPRKKPMRSFFKNQLFLFTYILINVFFGIYVRLRRAYHAVVNRVFAILYYHHRTPELIRKDIKQLNKLPEHLSVILQYNAEDQHRNSTGGLEALLNDVSEVAAWCASAGIPFLSVYEKTGILKNYIPQTHRAITQTLYAYFGPSSRPYLSLRAPNQPSFSPPSTPPSPTENGFPQADHDDETSPPDPSQTHITVLLLSADDGRNTLVDLTKTLAEMAQRNKLAPSDVSADLIDAEISESVMGEPDLVLLFGPRVVLEGYPPWQIRLSEIFHVPDNTEGVGYQVFLRAVHRYAKAQMRFGR